ncbi:zinc metalloprotease [Actinokineospora bangkokensis]|uniref:Zinc metalloprotease n=1 Tax=Actinokineospora bangkokensis TaxID=1193682 RepID=A0A1Q9LSC8_9PSEU|nr:zinc metalloprotease [Actinokineospora bangkokensis]OLR94957.1 zinc metalloprotease [Actinokineospora bangkokensis]
MRNALRALGVAALAAVATSFSPLSPAAPASAAPAADCYVPEEHGTAARGERPLDHDALSQADVDRIEAQTQRILATKRSVAPAAVTVPVYFHVMAAANGAGNVTDSQIAQQVAVLNTTYAGSESGSAASTGFSFTLAGTDRFYNDTWHRDSASTTYRSQTRKGGKNALNIWLVDFSYLGIATFPWDGNPSIDGIRVHFDSLPGGSTAHFNLGKTATHEAGHWFGLYHTFQGGCTSTNDSVSDTAAQSSATSGCPEGRDSCSLPGTDPIHNYMDYSYDDCYNQFTPGQSTRMSQMWSAYRA